MNADILFIVPAFSPSFKEESIGTLMLTKILKLNGYNAQILRYWEVTTKFNDYNNFSVKLVNRILNINPKIVSFYCRCSEYHICIDVSSKLKEWNKKVKIVYGGPQAELVAKESMEIFNFIDYICCSEGETTIVPLLKLIIDHSISEKDIKGLTYRDSNNKIMQNELPSLLDDSYQNENYYYDLVPAVVYKNSHIIPVDVGRGCPFSCTFCSTKTFWKRHFRLRDIDNTINEIEYVINTYGIKRFDLKHDLFTASRTRIIEFCDRIKERKLDIEWYCDSRIDTIDEKLIDIMLSAGVKSFFFGIESGSPRIQKRIKKELKLDRCETIIKYCLTKKIKVMASFIYGFPEETEEDLRMTLSLMNRLKLLGCNIQVNVCSIQNGTELYEDYKKFLFPSTDMLDKNLYFGYSELESLINNTPSVFVNFYDYPNPLRAEFKYLSIFINIFYANLDLTKRCLDIESDIILMYRLFCRFFISELRQHTLEILNLSLEKRHRLYLQKQEVFYSSLVRGYFR